MTNNDMGVLLMLALDAAKATSISMTLLDADHAAQKHLHEALHYNLMAAEVLRQSFEKSLVETRRSMTRDIQYGNQDGSHS